MKTSKDTPISEITLRKYEKPYELSGRDLVRKLCLSLGLLQPGDSRDVVVDVLLALLYAKKEQKLLSSEEVNKEVIEIRKEEKLPLVGVAGSNIRRQLRRLREAMLAEKVKNQYRINENSDLTGLFEEKIEKYLLKSINDRVKEYLRQIDKEFT